MKKYYPVTFSLDEIDYTANLTDANLKELFEKTRGGLTANGLLLVASLIEIQSFLNKLAIAPVLSNLVNSDEKERWTLFTTVSRAYLNLMDSETPDWEKELAPDQLSMITQYRTLLESPSPLIPLPTKK